MRKGLLLAFASFAFLISAPSVSAAELDIDSFDHEVIYQDEEITVGNFGEDVDITEFLEETSETITIPFEDGKTLLPGQDGFDITPFLTVTGPGGTARLDISDNRRTIYWSIKPAATWPWVFAGNLRLRYFSGFERNVAISASGLGGSTRSGYITLNAHKGGTVKLTGRATSLDGKNYKVLDHVTTPFAASR